MVPGKLLGASADPKALKLCTPDNPPLWKGGTPSSTPVADTHSPGNPQENPKGLMSIHP